jgi:hypothetical protein
MKFWILPTLVLIAGCATSVPQPTRLAAPKCGAHFQMEAGSGFWPLSLIPAKCIR